MTNGKHGKHGVQTYSLYENEMLHWMPAWAWEGYLTPVWDGVVAGKVKNLAAKLTATLRNDGYDYTVAEREDDPQGFKPREVYDKQGRLYGYVMQATDFPLFTMQEEDLPF